MEPGKDNKDKGSWYVEEPRHDQPQGGNGNPDPNMNPDMDPNIRQVLIHIAPNTMLVTASMVLGILTVATAIMGTVYLPFILGGIAIVMAILSRAEDGIMPFKSRIGVLLGTLGIILNILVVGTSVYKVFNDPAQYEAFDSVFERFYGQDFESFMADQGITVPVPTHN